MDKEIMVWVRAIDATGTLLKERQIIAHSQYDFLQKVLRACLDYVKDEDVTLLGFIDAEETEEFVEASFFRDGTFK